MIEASSLTANFPDVFYAYTPYLSFLNHLLANKSA
jgi:hypothetical protein